jgi:phosphatidate cytidylyltransferase
MLHLRIFSSCVLIAGMVLMVWFSRGWSSILIPLSFSLLGITALLEFYQLMQQKGFQPMRVWGCSFSVVYVFFLYLVALNQLPKGEELALIPMYLAVFTAALVITLRGQIDNALSTLAASLAGFLYITWLLSFNMRIVLWRGVDELDGRYFFVFFVVLLKSTDIAAYFYGSRFGRRKLAAHISPHKTVEGALAGLLTAALLGALLAPSLASVRLFYGRLSANVLGLDTLWTVALLGALTGVLLSVLGQLSDLAESVWKRSANVKDSASYIPGMGGALDVLDSFLFSAPAMFVLMKILERQ